MRILFTGGGTAGHVTPNLALMRRLLAEGWQVDYAGSKSGVERELVAAVPGVAYHAISTGKLRRYFSWQNFADPFRILRGVCEARRLIRECRPDVIFSKGGYVSVPVVIAAGKTPVVAHESDLTPGLANRIAARYADRVCVTFADTARHISGGRAVHTGTPIRPELYAGDRARALAFTGLSGQKPVLLVMGGSSARSASTSWCARRCPACCPRSTWCTSAAAARWTRRPPAPAICNTNISTGSCPTC